MKYKILNARSQESIKKAPILQKRRLLYQGGDEIISNAKVFMPQNIGEHEYAYNQRLQAASYVNYFASIVDFFAASLFSKDLSILPASNAASQDVFYAEFAKDADLQGCSFANVLKNVYKTMMIEGTAYVGVDFPSTSEEPVTLEQEEFLGASRAYLYQVDPDSVINYECSGNIFNWVVLRKEIIPQPSPFAPPQERIIQFKVWTMENNFAKYDIFEIRTKLGEDPSDDAECTSIASGKTSFKVIPVLRFKSPNGIEIGSKIATLVADHFKMRSDLFHAQKRSLYAIPYYKQSAEYDDSGSVSVLREDISRGARAASVMVQRGFAVLAEKDEIGFAEPAGKAYQLVNDELKETVDEIHRSVSQMAQSVSATSSGVARSAASKVQDNHAMEMLLSEYGHIMRRIACFIYEVISSARSENIEWEAHGLSNYEIVDRDQLLKESIAFTSGSVMIPSKTFARLHQIKLANSILQNVSPANAMQIEKEITEYYKKAGDELFETEKHEELEDEDEESAEDNKPTERKPASANSDSE